MRVSPPPPGARRTPAATPLWNSGQAVTSAAAPGTALAADRSRLKTALCCWGRRPARHRSGMHSGSVGMGRRVPVTHKRFFRAQSWARSASQTLGKCQSKVQWPSGMQLLACNKERSNLVWVHICPVRVMVHMQWGGQCLVHIHPGKGYGAHDRERGLSKINGTLGWLWCIHKATGLGQRGGRVCVWGGGR